MTNAQRWIRRYLAQEFELSEIRMENVGEYRVRVTDRNGEQMEFACNLYGDIMDPETSEIIAVANVDHSLSWQMETPTHWKNNDAYFNKPAKTGAGA